MTQTGYIPSGMTSPADACLRMPGSKSHANRALIAACLAEGTTRIDNATACEDVAHMVANVARLGFDVKWVDRELGRIDVRGGIPETGRAQPGEVVLECGDAGTTLRFLASLACLVPGRWTLTGSPRLRQRPIGPLVEALRGLGADVESDGDCPPLFIRGGTLRGGSTTLDARLSSQFLSSLMLIAPATAEGIQVETIGQVASSSYLRLTDKVRADFGVTRPGDRYGSPGEYTIEGDWSAYGAFAVWAELSGSVIAATNLASDSTQADRGILEHLEAMRGDGDVTIDCAETPDQLMNLAVRAAARVGTTHFVGAANLRYKECDRLAVVTAQLGRAGVTIEEHDDGITVRGPAETVEPECEPTRLDPHGDHRMAMAFAVLGTMMARGAGQIEILDPHCVAKSYPGFFGDFEAVLATPRCLALVGMRGAGKSTLGRALATELNRPFIDTDDVFRDAYGDIGDFVAGNGWVEFRRIECDLVGQALVPGNIVALGGGAVTSASVRKHLAEHAFTVWIEADAAELARRIGGEPADRPALTDHPGGAVGEVASVLEERLPLYREVADTTLLPGSTIVTQVGAVRDALRDACSW